MNKVSIKLTVYFEDPFWVGVFERVEDNSLSVCRVVFGSEPTNNEVYNFILKNYNKLRFSQNINIKLKKKATNPKRLQREAGRQSKKVGVSTKSQLALERQKEKYKLEKQANKKQKMRLEKKKKYELKKRKRKQKHKGK